MVKFYDVMIRPLCTTTCGMKRRFVVRMFELINVKNGRKESREEKRELLLLPDATYSSVKHYFRVWLKEHCIGIGSTIQYSI